MSNVTSLSLLKGAKAAELGEELAKPDAAPAVEAPAEETVSVDVDTMSSEELDILVAEHGIEVPEEWPTLNVEAKRDWLKSQFEEAPEPRKTAGRSRAGRGRKARQEEGVEVEGSRCPGAAGRSGARRHAGRPRP